MISEIVGVGFIVGFSIGIFAICIICLIFSMLAYSKVVGFENSTHQVQYVDPTSALSGKDDEEEVLEDFNPFVLNKEVNLSAVELSEDLEKIKTQKKYDRVARKAFLGGDSEE